MLPVYTHPRFHNVFQRCANLGDETPLGNSADLEGYFVKSGVASLLVSVSMGKGYDGEADRSSRLPISHVGKAISLTEVANRLCGNRVP